MAKYFVKYRVGDQILETGTIGAIPDVEAPNVRAVFDVVRAAGGTVISVEEIRESALARFWDKLLHLNLNFRFGASASEWAMLCDILGALLKSGVSVLNAVRLAAAEGANPWLTKKMTLVADAIEDGKRLSDAMEGVGNGRVFPFTLVSAIRSGEESGEVPVSLEKMADLFRRRAEIRRETISAMIYPAIAILVFIAVCIVLVVKIPPALEDAAGEDINKVMYRLPWVIRQLFFLQKNPQFIFVPFTVIVAWNVILSIGRKLQATRLFIAKYIDRRVPFVGKMRAEFALVDFLESVSLNEKSGIKLTESLELITRTSSDPMIQDAVGRIRERIVDTGEPFAQAIGREEVFPGLVRQMIAAANVGGNLSEMLDPLASFYDLTAKASLKRMIDAMTPLMIILLGSVIGPVVGGIYKTLTIMTQMAGGM